MVRGQPPTPNLLLVFLTVKHRNVTNFVKATTVACVSPGLSNHVFFSLCSSCVARSSSLLPVNLFSAVSHRGPRKYLHQIRHLCVVPFTSFLCSCYIGESCMDSEATRQGLASSNFSRLLYTLETLLVGGCHPLTSPKWCLTLSTLSGGNTKVPPIPVATSPTLSPLSKRNSVPVRTILSTTF